MTSMLEMQQQRAESRRQPRVLPEPELRPSDAINLAGQDTGREHLSHTKLSVFLACQRKYQLHYVARLERLDRPAALSMGKAFQVGIEHGNPARAYDDMMQGADELTGGAEDYDRVRIQAATVQAAAATYLRTWPAPAAEEREMEYLIQLRNPWTGHYSRTFDLKGYADGVIDHGAHLELVENKHVSTISRSGVRGLLLDQQINLACYSLWRATGKTVREVRYRYTRKPSIKPRQNESTDEFIARLEQDYVDRPDFYTHEEVLFRSDEDLLRTEAELWVLADQLRQAGRQKVYPRNTASCGAYGGCPMTPICAGEPGARDLYRVRPERTTSPIPSDQEIAA